MYLDYSKLALDANGIPETPTLVLQTLSNKTIGVIPGVSNLKMNIKFSEPSEITFDVPSVIDGQPNWVYDELTGYRVIYTEHYGVYVTMNPAKDADGISDIKSIKAYSIEKTLDTKKFFLEEGTFKFYESTNPYDGNTIMGRILEIAVGWRAGYISPTIAQRYRTFSQYDDYLLSFIYNTAPDKYRCVFVFDPYQKTINVYDADEERSTLPIYLDFDNLLESVGIEELSDELVTAIRPYGADGLDIREVNPIGTNWIYDLSYFVTNGDIPSALAEKYEKWQRSVLNNRPYFEGLSSLRASATARLLAAKAALVELQGELENLTAQQSVTIQALANETTSQGKQTQQQILDDINAKIAAKNQEVTNQSAVIADIESELDASNPSSCAGKINAIVEELDIANYFTKEEYAILANYFIEQDIIEDTFVATDINESLSGNSYVLTNQTVKISGSSISEIDLSTDFKKKMYSIAGGKFSFSGSSPISGDVVRGTLEVASNNSFVLSIYGGSIRINDSTASSGMITISGTLSDFASDISAVTDDGVTTFNGTTMQFYTASSSMYLTANINDYKRYSVKMELYRHGVSILDDLATPTYEFSVESGNFLFAKEFAPFREKLELGKGIYLNIGDKQTITPYIIEFEIDFEDKNKFSIIFSNRFKRHDAVNTLSDMIKESYSSSRSFDASKYIYNQAANQATQVSQFMQSSLDAAVNTIIAAANQSVIINGAGIHIGGNSPYQIRIVDSMIAMSDDNWATSKLAIGLFSSAETGTYFGVNAEVIGGKLIVGNNLIIENMTDDGVMQFMVDASGAWLNNATFVLQDEDGGNIIIDPNYGILAGNGNLFTTEGTTVTPSFIDSNGGIVFDNDGMPKNANFYLDIRDGSAYFRGKVNATSGEIGGFTIEEDYLHAGSGSNFVALNGSGSNTNSLYAMWAGGSTPATAKFWVKKDGTISAKTGKFSGTLSAARLSGNLTADTDKGGWLIGCGINVNNGAFYVDQSGNVTMKGGINLTGNITWGTSNSPVRVLYARTYLSKPTLAYSSYPSSSSHDWHQTMSVAYDYYASYSYDGGQTWTDAVKIQGTDGRDGQDGQDGIDGSDATVNERNVFNVLTNGGTKFGIFSDSTSNRLYINANYIRTGLLDADLLELTCGYGGFSKGYGSTGTYTTYGSMMYGSNGNGYAPYFIVTNTGCRMTASDTPGEMDFFITGGGIYASEEITIRSDRRLKNSINYNFDRYEDFFMHLKPATFKYNNGKGGRFHSGFIAQDVEKALKSAGLSTVDFAGLVITPVEEVNEADGITDNYYKLRYGEFISLNTYMIQKLCRRIEELENKLNEE